MSETAATIKALSEEFPKHVIRTKPGSSKRPAMPYVSHGSVTKRLNELCPGWSDRVVETHTYINGNGVLVCAAVLLELTIPGVGSRQEFGTANQPRNFGDDAKNAASDALKRCAMRFGVALDLWESADEHDEDAAAPDQPTPAPTRATRPQPLAAAPVGSPYDDAEYQRLSRQVRVNDEALSGAEYSRYHELTRLQKERQQPTATPAPTRHQQPQDEPKPGPAPLQRAEFLAFFREQAKRFRRGTETPYILQAIKQERPRFTQEQYQASLAWWQAFSAGDHQAARLAIGDHAEPEPDDAPTAEAPAAAGRDGALPHAGYAGGQ